MLGIQCWIVDHIAQSKPSAKVVLPSSLPLIWECYASGGPLLWILTTCSMPFGTTLGSIFFLIFTNYWGILDRWHALKSDTHCLIKSGQVPVHMPLSSKAEHNMVSFQRQEQTTENGHRLQPLIFMGWRPFFLVKNSLAFA